VGNKLEAPLKNPVSLVGHALKQINLDTASHPVCLLLIVRHLLNAVAISVLTSFSFQRFPDGEPVALFSGVGVRLKK